MNKSVKNGFSQIFVLLGMFLLALSLPLATNLVKQSQDDRSRASETASTSKVSFKIAFKGVKPSYLDNTGNFYTCFDQLDNFFLEIVNRSKKIYQNDISYSFKKIDGETNKNGDQVFLINNLSLNDQFYNSGSSNYFRVKAISYLSSGMCFNNQDNQPDNIDNCNITLNNNEIYNFSNYSIKPGDLNQDGLVNSLDYSIIKKNFSSNEDITCGQTGDLNLDGQVNSLDGNLLKQSFGFQDDILNQDDTVEIFSNPETEDNLANETEDDITDEITLVVTPEIISPTPTLTPTPTKTQSNNPINTPTITPTPTQGQPVKDTKIIFLGDSRVVLLAGHDGKLKMNYGNKNIIFVAKGGTRYSDWFENNSKYMKKVYDIIDKLSDQKCAIIIGLAGNDLNHITASSASQGRQKIVDLTTKYKNSLVSLANKYTNQCTIYFTSVNPVQLHKKVTVYSYTSSKALTKTGRSNIKIETFNNSLKNLIESANISNLKYIDTNSYFVESKDKLKNSYNTSDGTHYDSKTTQIVYNKTIELAGL